MAALEERSVPFLSSWAVRVAFAASLRADRRSHTGQQNRMGCCLCVDCASKELCAPMPTLSTSDDPPSECATCRFFAKSFYRKGNMVTELQIYGVLILRKWRRAYRKGSSTGEPSLWSVSYRHLRSRGRRQSRYACGYFVDAERTVDTVQRPSIPWMWRCVVGGVTNTLAVANGRPGDGSERTSNDARATPGPSPDGLVCLVGGPTAFVQLRSGDSTNADDWSSR